MNVRAGAGPVVGPQLPQTLKGLSLRDQIKDFAAKVNDTVDNAHRNICIRLFNSIVFDTPVDTGLAVGNWQATMGTPAIGVVVTMDKTKAKTYNAIEQNVKADHQQIGYLTNNLHYILPLEMGWSGKSPEGMVRINVMRFQRIVEETIQDTKK